MDKLLQTAEQYPLWGSICFERLLEEDRSEPKAIFGRGLVHVCLGEYRQAITWLLEARDHPQTAIHAGYWQAMALLGLKDYTGSKQLLIGLLTIAPNDVRLHIALTEIYRLLKNPTQAKLHFDRSLAIAPLHPRVYLVGSVLEGSNPLTVEAVVRIATRTLGKNAASFRALGEAFAQQNQFDAATHLYEKALSFSEEAVTHAAIAGSLWLDNEPNAAIQHLHRAMELAPKDPEHYVQLGKCLFAAGDLPSLQQLINLAAQHQLEPSRMAELKGIYHTCAGDHAQALPYFLQLIAQRPDYTPGYEYATEGCRMLKQYDQGAGIAYAGLERAADHANLLAAYATVCSEAGLPEPAGWAWERRMAIGPAPADRCFDAVNYLYLLGEVKSGIRLLPFWERQWPEDHRIDFYRGGYFITLDQHSRALAAYQSFLAKSPTAKEPQWRNGAIFNMAVCYVALRQLDKARAIYEEFLRANPRDVDGCLGMGQIAWLEKNFKEAKVWYDKCLPAGHDNPSVFVCLAGLPIDHNPDRQRHFLRVAALLHRRPHFVETRSAYRVSKEYDLPLVTYRLGKLLFEQWEVTELGLARDAYIQAAAHTLPFRQLIDAWRKQAPYTSKQYLSEAIVNFYLGDVAAAYQLLVDMVVGSLPMNAMAWYYLLLSTDQILEPRATYEKKALDFVRSLLDAKAPLSAGDRYYAGLVLHMCGDLSGAMAVMESIADRLPIARYCLAYWYGMEPGGEVQKAAYLAELRADEWSGNSKTLFQLGVKKIYPRAAITHFLADIRELLYFLEQQDIIAPALYGPLEIKEPFLSTIVLDPEAPEQPELYLGHQYKRARQEFLERDLDQHRVQRKADGYRGHGPDAETEIGLQLYNAARTERAERKGHEETSLINFKLETAAIGELLKNRSLSAVQGSHLLLYIKYCMDSLSVPPDHPLMEFLAGEILDKLLELDKSGTLSAIKKTLQVGLAVKKSFSTQKRPIATYPEFLDTVTKMEQEV